MKLSDLRASVHFKAIGDSVSVTRDDGVVFQVSLCFELGERFYNAYSEGAVWNHCTDYDTATTLRGIIATIKAAQAASAETNPARHAVYSAAKARPDVAVQMTRELFLRTREEVSDVCKAMGLRPDDGIVEEVEECGDVVKGWTYLNEWAGLMYMVQYPNGDVGACFGEMEIREKTLELAEQKLWPYVVCNAEGQYAQQLAVMREFPEYDTALPVVPGFVNTSWHNDMCPSLSMLLPALGYEVRLLCDYLNPDLREENDGGKQFVLCIYSGSQVDGDHEEVYQQDFDAVLPIITTDALTIIYTHWLRTNDMSDAGCAAELSHEARVTSEQRAWLSAFCAVWDDTQDLEDGK